MVKSWSTTQAIIALSSGEAEFYGIVKGASVGLGMRSIMRDLGIDCKVKVNTDASAAKGIATRKGLGKVRHIEVNQLWVQDKVGKGEIEISKISGAVNLADALTKHVDSERIAWHVANTGQSRESSRHEIAPQTVDNRENSEKSQGDHGGDVMFVGESHFVVPAVRIISSSCVKVSSSSEQGASSVNCLDKLQQYRSEICSENPQQTRSGEMSSSEDSSTDMSDREIAAAEKKARKKIEEIIAERERLVKTNMSMQKEQEKTIQVLEKKKVKNAKKKERERLHMMKEAREMVSKSREKMRRDLESENEHAKAPHEEEEENKRAKDKVAKIDSPRSSEHVKPVAKAPPASIMRTTAQLGNMFSITSSMGEDEERKRSRRSTAQRTNAPLVTSGESAERWHEEHEATSEQENEQMLEDDEVERVKKDAEGEAEATSDHAAAEKQGRNKIQRNRVPPTWEISESEIPSDTTVFIAHVRMMHGVLLEKILMLNGELPWGHQEVVGVKFPRESSEEGKFRGFAYIRWRTRELAQRCIEMFHNREFQGMRLDVSLSESRNGERGDIAIEKHLVGTAIAGKPRLFEKVWQFPDEIREEK